MVEEIPEVDTVVEEVVEDIESFTELYHNDKIIGKVNSYNEIGEVDGLKQYNANIELEDDKHIPLFESKHRIVAQEGKLTLESL